MFAGPLLTREMLTASRQPKHYLMRAGYVFLMFVLLYTAGQVVFGWQQVRLAGDMARFGHFVFNVAAILQLTLVAAFSLLTAASNVAQEKDRRTLVILLMTDLSGYELVVGKMFASLVNVLTLIVVSLPVLGLLTQLGGVTLSQVIRLELLCCATAIMVAGWSTLVAYWREKTFQTLAIATLGMVLFLAVTAGASQFVSGGWLNALNPYSTLSSIVNPLAVEGGLANPAITAGLIAPAIVGVICAIVAVLRVRIWNPPRIVHAVAKEGENAVVRPPREVWDKPILWREMRTLAYGKKMIFIKLAYVALAAFGFYAALSADPDVEFAGALPPIGLAIVLLGLVSLILLNAQAVTSITTERDGQTLELLLVTEVPAREFVTSKLLGCLYNGKELIAAPFLLTVVAIARGLIDLEGAFYVIVGIVVLALFAAVLGLHFGITYGSSRRAIAGSLGTMAFLFLGIFVCMLLIVEGRSSFASQLTPFLVFILGGSLGLWAALTHRTPSPALVFGSIVLPFLTFYALTSFLLAGSLGVALSIVFAYGFTTVAMIVPAVSEYNIALGSGGRE